MTGATFKIVVIPPEAKKNIYLSIDIVHKGDSRLRATTYTSLFYLCFLRLGRSCLCLTVGLG